jgi:FkbM family methyltransferase
VKSLLKAVVSKTPYRIVRRTDRNRFQANEEAVLGLARRGMQPTHVVDGGAHTGDFARSAMKLFPDAVIHLIEPQPSCLPALQALKATAGNRALIHPTALCSATADGGEVVLAADAGSPLTGAHVVPDVATHRGPTISVPARALDQLLAPHVGEKDRVFLKLDLQGYELEALQGATCTLALTEALLIEVSFYAQAFEPPISELVRFLSDHNFELYDVASLYARPRDNRPRQGDFVFVRASSSLAADRRWS